MALWLHFSSVWVWWTPPAGQHLLLWNSPGPVWSKDQANYDLIFVILPACPGRNTYQPSEPPGLRQPGHLVIYTWPPGDPHLVSAGPSTTSKSRPSVGEISCGNSRKQSRYNAVPCVRAQFRTIGKNMHFGFRICTKQYIWWTCLYTFS